MKEKRTGGGASERGRSDELVIMLLLR